MNIIIKSNFQFSVTSIHYAPNGELKAELWMDEPSDGVLELGAKTLSSFVYSFINEPYELLTGHTIGGSDVDTEEKAIAVISTLSAGLSSILGKGVGIIKTKGDTGLSKYNDFVKQSGGRHGRTQVDMGELYQKNKRAYYEYEQGKRIFGINEKGLSLINTSLNE